MNVSTSDTGTNGASGTPPNKPARAAAAVGDAAHAAADKISGAAQTVAAGVTSAQQRGSDAIKDAGESMRAGVETATATMSERSDRLFGSARAYTKENPLLALGMAAGAGIILSRLFRR